MSDKFIISEQFLNLKLFRNISYAVVTAIIMMACQDDHLMDIKPSSSAKKITVADLGLLVTASTSSNLTATLLTEDGTIVSPANLKPNMLYSLTLKGQNFATLVLRNYEGFDIVSEKKYRDNMVYLIRTKQHVLDQLYVSVVPVVMEDNVFKKQVSKSFLLPKTNL